MRARLVGVLVVVVALVVPAIATAYGPEFEHVYLEESYSGWRFGASVDVDREIETVITGSPRLEAAFVVTRDADGWFSWVLQPEDPEAKFDFGAAVAIEGDLAVVGAPGYRGPLKQLAGALFLYRHRGERWHLESILQADQHDDPNNHHAELMGRTLAVDDGVIVAGAPGLFDIFDSRVTWREGSVYVFEEVDGEWVSQHLPNPSAGRNERFGGAVAIEGDLIAVGAINDDEAASRAGAVYLYRRSDAGEWVLDTKILPEDAIRNLEFGSSVSIHDGAVAVGARAGWSPRGPYGRLYLIEETAAGWGQTIIAQDVDGHSSFGSAVYFDGRQIFVASYGYRDPSDSPGTVFVYETSPAGWVLSEEIEGDPDDHGWATSMAGDADAIVFGSEAHSPRGDYSGEVSIAGIPEVTCAGQVPTVWGTREDDELVATIDPDVIYAGAGDDTISEVRADDIVCTGFGTDTVIADQMPRVVDVSPQDHVIVAGFRRGAIDLG